MKTLASVGPLKLLDPEREDGVLRLEDEDRAICDLTSEEAGALGRALLIASGLSHFGMEGTADVWVVGGELHAFSKGSVWHYAEDGDLWSKCENSDSLNEGRARALLVRALVQIDRLGMEVSGVSGDRMADEMSPGSGYVISKKDD